MGEGRSYTKKTHYGLRLGLTESTPLSKKYALNDRNLRIKQARQGIEMGPSYVTSGVPLKPTHAVVQNTWMPSRVHLFILIYASIYSIIVRNLIPLYNRYCLYIMLRAESGVFGLFSQTHRLDKNNSNEDYLGIEPNVACTKHTIRLPHVSTV